jgi:hypothetical protein
LADNPQPVGERPRASHYARNSTEPEGPAALISPLLVAWVPSNIFGRMADAPRELGNVFRYEDLHAILRARCAEIGLARAQLDEIAGLPDSYATKILAPRPMRTMGSMALSVVLPVLGVRLVAIEDPEALSKTLSHSKYRPRVEKAAVHAGTVDFSFSRRHMRKIQQKGGENSRAYISKERAREIAIKANQVRWGRARARAD